MKRSTVVSNHLKLTKEEIDRMEQIPFRAVFRIIRDQLPKAIVVRRGKTHL